MMMVMITMIIIIEIRSHVKLRVRLYMTKLKSSNLMKFLQISSTERLVLTVSRDEISISARSVYFCARTGAASQNRS
jgi:hypothetical protein